MADKVEFELVSPEKLLISQPVDMVVVPGAEGNFGVLAGHSPFISTIRPGVIDIFEAAGLKKPDISILSDEFLAEVRGLPHGVRVLASWLAVRLGIAEKPAAYSWRQLAGAGALGGIGPVDVP